MRFRRTLPLPFLAEHQDFRRLSQLGRVRKYSGCSNVLLISASAMVFGSPSFQPETLLGILQWILQLLRSHITFAVSLLSCFATNPNKDHC